MCGEVIRKKRRAQPYCTILFIAYLPAERFRCDCPAACVEVEVDLRRGRIRVIDVCQTFECGAIQNPANLRAQVEGCIIMGLGAALRERIEFEDGQIRNPVFSEYFVPRFEDVPKIDTVLLDRPDLLSVGAGETPIIAIAPAIANAVYQATGRRIRAMPMEPRLGATR